MSKKEKILDNFKKGVKISIDSVKSVYHRSVNSLFYISSSSLFCITNSENEEKLIHGIFDENNLILYVKENNFEKAKSFLKIGNSLKEDHHCSEYQITRIDEKPFDYLLKVNKTYKTIKCFPIYLKKMS